MTIDEKIAELVEKCDGSVDISTYLSKNGIHSPESNDVIQHYGTEHEGTTTHSGRYEWGSGENPYKRSFDLIARKQQLLKEGLSEKDISAALGVPTRKVRAANKIVKEYKQAKMPGLMYDLQNEGKSIDELAHIFDVSPNTVRNKIKLYEKVYIKKEDVKENSKKMKALDLAENLRKIVDEKKYVDVGKGVETQLGVSAEFLDGAIDALKNEGYQVYTDVKIEQVTNKGKYTSMKILATPDASYAEAWKPENIKPLSDYKSRDGGATFEPSFIYPSALDSKRVGVRYADEGGLERDGMIEIRPGKKDLSLGADTYAQVRILVDGTHYIKGVAVYASDTSKWPAGVDVMVNSNKTKEKAPTKLDALKSVKKNLDKDPDNPFGSAIKEVGGQSFYDDPNGKYTDPVTGKKQSLSYINKRASEGDWNQWSDTLPSQFLAKQSLQLINRQLKTTIDQTKAEYDEISKLTNPSIRKKMLESFADGCDTSAENLKAAPLPGQKFKVILPMPSLKDNEIYAPSYENGTQLAIVRFPHAGRFEIPILTVNNNNKEGQALIGNQPKDAVGINAYNAETLSGADFDGDTVLCIPISDEINIKNAPRLKGLVGFETKAAYGADHQVELENGEVEYYREGKKYKLLSESREQLEMGMVSNLITDMTLRDASLEELTRAVKHSMVVIDSVKHHLDYQASEKENGIPELRKKYQNHADALDGHMSNGASTLMSLAKNPKAIPERKDGAFFSRDTNKILDVVDENKGLYMDPDTGEVYKKSQVKTLYVDPSTGEKLYHDTHRKYYKVTYADDDGKKHTVNAWQDKNGKVAYYKANTKGESDKAHIFIADNSVKIEENNAMIDATRMSLVKDANILSSGTVQEQAYANYANFMKAMANQARKEAYWTKEIKKNNDAEKEYADEVASLIDKYNASILNAPKERAAQIFAINEIHAKKLAAEANGEPWSKEDEKKKRQSAIKTARALVGAKRNPVMITEKEYEAIQAGALSIEKLNRILDACDDKQLKKIATPHEGRKLSTSDISKAKARLKNGYMLSDVARDLGVSVSTLTKNL